MGFCPVPHTFRDQVWLAVGTAIGFTTAKLIKYLLSSSSVNKSSKTAVLHYFQGRGLAESSRWLLAATEVPFHCPRYTSPQQFIDAKESGFLPFGQLPLLEIDGLNLTQSSACINYLAKRGGLAYDDAVLAARCDMLLGVTSDLGQPARSYPFQEDLDAAKQAMQDRLDKFGPKIEAFIQQNDESVYAVGSRMSHADVVLSEVLSYSVELLPECLKQYPGMTALYKAVISTPSLKTYLASNQRHQLKDAMKGYEYARNVKVVLSAPIPAYMA